jgi:hypothetical protein
VVFFKGLDGWGMKRTIYQNPVLRLRMSGATRGVAYILIDRLFVHFTYFNTRVRCFFCFYAVLLNTNR